LVLEKFLYPNHCVLWGKMAKEEEPKKELRVWVANLSKLICGEENCHRRFWDRMRGKKEKDSADKRLMNWQINHTNMILDFIKGLDGKYKQLREEWIGIKILNGEVRGGMDLLCLDDKEVQVHEFKSGKEHGSHHIQTLIYLFMLKKNGFDKGKELTGVLHYPNRDIPYTLEDIPEDMQELIEKHAKILLNNVAPNCTCGNCKG